MGATRDNEITVNIWGSAQSVRQTSFGLIAICSDGPSFTGDSYRLYESNSDAQEDSELDSATKSAVATFFAQDPHPRRVLVAKVTYENLGGELTTSLDSLYAATQGSSAEPYAYCVLSRADADVTALGAWALSNSKLAWVQTSSADAKSGTTPNPLDTLQSAANERTAPMWHGTDTDNLDVGWAAKVLAVDLDTKSTVAYDKTVSGISVDDLTATEMSNIEDQGGNTYLPIYGLSVTGPGKCASGMWIDERLIKDWLKARIAESVAQLRVDMSARGEKIPYDNAGLAMIEKAIRSITNKAEQAGHIMEGETVITVPDISDVSDADKVARKATIPVTVTLTGAIKEITIDVGVLAA